MTAKTETASEIPVFVVVSPQVLLLDIAGPMEVLRKANLEQDAVQFNVAYIGPRATVGSSVGLFISSIAPLPAHVPAGSLVVLAGTVETPLKEAITAGDANAQCEQEIVTWLSRVIRPGIRLVSICSGALLAARAGLLDDHECTTHHATIAQLAALAPAARIRENRLYVDDGERLTSAGVTAGIDLMLHIVAQMVGHAVALAVARYLVVYLRRAGADPQLSPWLEGRNHIHPAIHRAQDAIAADPAREWTLSSLAKTAAASPRNLSRLFNLHAGMSVTDYVNRMRIALAHDLVLGSRLDMEQVAEQAGFASARQFRRVWNRFHALPPGRLRLERNGR